MTNSVNKESNISRNDCIIIKPSTKFNNINLFPQQAGSFLELMPSNYIYNLQKWSLNEKENNFTFEVDLSSEEEFQIWFEAFKIKSCCQFNVRTSKKGEGKYMLLRTLYKCIHNVHGGILGKRKHTGCPTQLKVTIYPSKRKQFLSMDERRSGTCKMQLLWNHNHPLKAADALRSQMDRRLRELYSKGHNPTTARQMLLKEAEEQGKDVSGVPDYKHIYYVFKKLNNCEFNAASDDNSINLLDGLDIEYDRADMDNDIDNLCDEDNNNICNDLLIADNPRFEPSPRILDGVTSSVGVNLEDENGIVFLPFPITTNYNKSLELNSVVERREIKNVETNETNNYEHMDGMVEIIKNEIFDNFRRLIDLSLVNPDSIDVLTKLCKLLQNIKSPRAAITFLRKITTKRKSHKYKRLNKSVIQ